MRLKANPAEDTCRRAEQRALTAAARLRPNSWSSIEVAMLDVSEHGFRARSEARLKPGAAVSLDIAGLGATDAQVEWWRDGEFGARFFVPIDLGACAWSFNERQAALAQLLVARARAKASGRPCAEARLRREILSGLTIRKGSAAG
ncbi:MAG TPA: hypothetical protein VEZ70_04630 [Allosphingosinicella sp.]|nr:hypothetical protein [Allosphingosinicella sp.]